MSGAARVAWFRFRATFGRRLGGYIAIVILIGLTGGIALGSLAGARRTQSSYPKFLRSTNPSDLTVSAFGSSGDAAAALTKDIARLPAVKHVRTLDVPTFATLSPTGAPAPVSTVFTIASPDGEMSTQDRLSVVHGRMSDPGAADQAVVTASAAQQLRAHVGDVLHLGLFTSHTAPPKLRVDVTVVGIVTFDNQVIEDDIDAAWGFVMLTPALLQRATAAAPGAISPTLYALQLEHGAADVARVERELVTKIPPGAQYEFHATAPVVAQDEDAIRPESIALGAFGAIAFLVTMVIAAQAVARQLRAGDDERNILRALGADPTMATADALLGVLGAIVLGSLLTVIVALALSPLAPLGPVRVVYPGSGIALDWTVLGFGGAGFVLVLGAVALVIAFRRAPHRVARRAELAARQSRAARTATNVGLPIAAATGARFALERGSGKGAVPMRSALSGTVLAVAMVVATLTFASGLHTLISHPAL